MIGLISIIKMQIRSNQLSCEFDINFLYMYPKNNKFIVEKLNGRENKPDFSLNYKTIVLYLLSFLTSI